MIYSAWKVIRLLTAAHLSTRSCTCNDRVHLSQRRIVQRAREKSSMAKIRFGKGETKSYRVKRSAQLCFLVPLRFPGRHAYRKRNDRRTENSRKLRSLVSFRNFEGLWYFLVIFIIQPQSLSPFSGRILWRCWRHHMSCLEDGDVSLFVYRHSVSFFWLCHNKDPAPTSRNDTKERNCNTVYVIFTLRK